MNIIGKRMGVTKMFDDEKTRILYDEIREAERVKKITYIQIAIFIVMILVVLILI